MAVVVVVEDSAEEGVGEEVGGSRGTPGWAEWAGTGTSETGIAGEEGRYIGGR